MKGKHTLMDMRLNTMLLLNYKARHGYELIKDLAVLSGKRVSPGQVYPLLKSLQKDRLVEITKRGIRDKKTYSLTKLGRRAVVDAASKMHDLLDFFVRSKTKSCVRCGCKVYKGGFKVSEGAKTLYFCCGSCAGTYKKCKRWR